MTTTFERMAGRLGVSSADRVVVLHADDIGMCAATVSAYRDIVARGILSSASTMVPCGWLPAVARACRETSRHDMGVHLTLTSEWGDYRWGPLTGSAGADLCDDLGYFHPRTEDVYRTASLEAARRELSAQIERARAHGIDITHIDSHMFVMLGPRLIPMFGELSRQYRVPCCFLRRPTGPRLHGEMQGESQAVDPMLDVAAREGHLVFDGFAEMPLGESVRRVETASRLLDGLPAGLSYFISHPAADDAELRAITPDWEARVADYRLYMDDAWAKAIDASGVKVVGMRALRDALFAPEET